MENPSNDNGAGSLDGSLIGTFLSNLSGITDYASKRYFNINHTYSGPGDRARRT